MGWKTGKNLENILRKATIITMSIPLLIGGGCKKPEEPPVEPPKDTTPPKITIISPVEQQVYNSDTILFQWAIDELHFNKASYSIDNEQTKTTIEKSGSKKLNLTNGNYKIIVDANDSSSNFSTAYTNFSVDKITPPTPIIINPFIQPNDSTLNWYGSGDVNNDNTVNSQDLTRMNELIAGTFSDPSDTRLYDRADVNGDGTVNGDDRKILQDRLNGVIAYLPGEWNKLTKREEREDWIRKMLKIDKTNEIPWSSEFDCTKFEIQIMINFHGYGDQKDISKILTFYPLNFSNNHRFNLPTCEFDLVAYNSEGKSIKAHAINGIFVGSTISWDNLLRFEPQNDSINPQIGEGYLSPYGTNSKIYIRGPPVKEAESNYISTTDYIVYYVNNNTPTLSWTNPNLVTQRGK